jgi:ferritin-like metal-binding protein YciE
MANGSSRELLIAWLKDAHAMERGLVPILENHAKDAERHPAVRARIEQHANETRRHAELLEECLERFGESTSTIKAGASRIMGAVESIATGPFGDEEVKNALMDYATENFEIAAYRALIEGAESLEEQEVADICQEILQDEEDMADFLEEQLPTTVRDAMMAAA